MNIEKTDYYKKEIREMREAENQTVYTTNEGAIEEMSLYDFVMEQAPETPSPRGVEDIIGLDILNLYLIVADDEIYDWTEDAVEAEQMAKDEEYEEVEIRNEDIYKTFEWSGQRKINIKWFDNQEAAAAYNWKWTYKAYLEHPGGCYTSCWESREDIEEYLQENA